MNQSGGSKSAWARGTKYVSMRPVPTSIIESAWNQATGPLPLHELAHPDGCHRPRTPDGIVFAKLVQVLIFGCAHWRIADPAYSATTPHRRRLAGSAAGSMDSAYMLELDTYDRGIGLTLEDIAVDWCITKATNGGEETGRNPGERGQTGPEEILGRRDGRHSEQGSRRSGQPA